MSVISLRARDSGVEIIGTSLNPTRSLKGTEFTTNRPWKFLLPFPPHLQTMMFMEELGLIIGETGLSQPLWMVRAFRSITRFNKRKSMTLPTELCGEEVRFGSAGIGGEGKDIGFRGGIEGEGT